ncbi:Leucine-rich repeat, cysteine-containing subtype [Artemisia annua]|uniref:Leucine-rich repeat, cysteine-containing subtype n=1 Tax=Artemisia annua TaxID=35608 RepID=A0A2U1PUE7_ARTAN|nr:Leucine-rich repeat, cysteine-containing subtype [Artemisia annua]
MERLGDDELICIFDKIDNHEDRKSFYQVSKNWLKVACIRLRELDISFPGILDDILPASPYIVKFTCLKPLSNTYLNLLAHSCPKLQYLNLEQDLDPEKEDCEAGHGVEHDDEVDLTERLLVRDVRFDSIVRSCKNLTYLDLGGCLSVTDESLKSLGASKSITKLILTGCMITDLGLEYLANGDLKNCLESLHLDECDRVSDVGFSHLKQMVILYHLVLSNCGVLNTDSGTLAISQIPNINTLHLLSSTNVTDISLSNIASTCKKLKFIYLLGCEAITGEGLRCFAHHPTLHCIKLYSCDNISWEDVELVVSTCPSLTIVGLSRRLKTPMPETGREAFNFGDKWCWIDWD